MLRAAPAALALVLALSAPASAGPTERLRDLFAAVNTVLTDPTTESDPLERVARIRGLVGEAVDVNRAAAGALGHEWQALSPVEQGEFAALFAELLERAYVGRLAGRSRVANGVRIAYLDELVTDDEATVRTSLGARDGGEARVEYRMVNRLGRWRVHDLVLDGVSTIENYRAQFRRLLRQAPYPNLIRQIKAKLDERSFMFARAVVRSAPLVPSPLELVLIAPPDDWAIFRDSQPPGPRAAAPRRSRDIGWVVGASAPGAAPSGPPAPLRSRDVGWVVGAPAAPGAARAAYWVQAGAFNTAAGAGRLAERLDGGTVVSSAGGRLLLVRVGPFAQPAQAVAKLHELETLGYRPYIAEAPR